jgi:hypothetical protein
MPCFEGKQIRFQKEEEMHRASLVRFPLADYIKGLTKATCPVLIDSVVSSAE